MAEDDDDKTVFGQPLPVPPRPQAQPRPPASAPPQDDGDRTVFGTPLPPAQNPQQQAPRPAAPPPQYTPPPPQSQPPQYTPPPQPPQPQYRPPVNPEPPRVAPTPPPRSPIQQPPHQTTNWGPPPQEQDDTWLGGSLPPHPTPPPQPGPAPALPPQPAPYPGQSYRPDTGQRSASEQMFPEIRHQEEQTAPRQHRKIPLADALRASGLGEGGSTNPLLASAANLLILLGRLRTGLVEMQSAPLLEHVAREIDLFERNALQKGVPPDDVRDAKYALSATADDIVQNLPGADRGMWLEYSMGAQFFGERNSGVGFFQRMDAAMKAPGQKFHLLELMLTCLSLGFEGQYRAMPNGTADLARIRAAIYDTLRRVQPRADEDISVRWLPVVLRGKTRRGGPPIWAIAGVGALMVVALFATLSTLLARQSDLTEQGIAAMHFDLRPVAIERTEPVVRKPEPPKTSQLDRLRTALAAPIESGEVEVDVKNEWIFVRVGDYLQFAPGSAELRSDFQQLAATIGAALDDEFGPVRVVGHTDSVKPSGRGRYKTNQDLSEARATTVAEILKTVLADPDRIAAEGKGAVDPIADNGTKEGQARNRRVEIMIPRED